MKRMSTLAIGLLIATAAFQFLNRAPGQSEGGWITLRDSTRMGDWDEIGKANPGTKDGAVAADWLEAKDPSCGRRQWPYFFGGGAFERMAGLSPI
jgi:hypothetical protein